MKDKYKSTKYIKDVSKDVKRLNELNEARNSLMRSYTPIMLAFMFLVLVGVMVSSIMGADSSSIIYIITGIMCGYMALNIGANDVANNVGPAVGSKSITMLGAVILAAIFEVVGAFVAGGDVTNTISKGIISVDENMDSSIFIITMFSALFAAAFWLNLATWVGAPVSTTHSIVGGVMGAGIMSLGFDVVNWTKISSIAGSWVISPFTSGIISALFYFALRHLVLKRKDKIASARFWVPIYIAIMSSGFTMYLMIKGLKKIIKFDGSVVLISGVFAFILAIFLMRPVISRLSREMENTAHNVSKLFQWPLIVSASLLSFAHGANDVANAIGPLAAIVSVADTGVISLEAGIPIWVMFIGAMGISVGLLLFGPKLIREVGENITRLDRVRASCVALSAALTVLVASWLGLPVSSTHIAVGGVFGIGLYREWVDYIKRKSLKQAEDAKHLSKRKLVRRKALITIASAWVITVPASACLSAGIYLILSNTNFINLF